MIEQKGFTLIETIIYIFLFTIIIGGGMTATYNIIESTNASHNHVILQEEANFLFRKISWTLNGADYIDDIDPLNPQTLLVKKTILGNSIPTDFIFTLTNDDLTLQRDLSSPINSNSESIAVSNVSFSKQAGGVVPDSVTMNFTLTTLENGRNSSQDFSFTKYLRTIGF